MAHEVRYKIEKDHVKTSESIFFLIRELEELFKKLNKSEILEIDLSDLIKENVSYNIIDEVIEPFICKKGKKNVTYGKPFYISNPNKAVKLLVALVLNKYGAAIIVKDKNVFEVIGNVMYSSAKKGKYPEILKLIIDKGCMTSSELAAHLDIEPPLAFYKLEKLYELALISREKFTPRGGGRGFIYLPLQLTKGSWKFT